MGGRTARQRRSLTTRQRRDLRDILLRGKIAPARLHGVLDRFEDIAATVRDGHWDYLTGPIVEAYDLDPYLHAGHLRLRRIFTQVEQFRTACATALETYRGLDAEGQRAVDNLTTLSFPGRTESETWQVRADTYLADLNNLLDVPAKLPEPRRGVGRPREYLSETIAFNVGRALAEAGIPLRKYRDGVYANALCFILDVTGQYVPENPVPLIRKAVCVLEEERHRFMLE